MPFPDDRGQRDSNSPPATILIVDDEPGIRGVLRRILESAGHQVLEESTGEGALAVLDRSGTIDLVVSDLHMPGRDGRWLLESVTTGHPDTGVIMLTGDADVEMAVACLTHGAMDYLTKPMLVDEVRARVTKALDNRRRQFEIRELRARYQLDLERQVLELSRKNEQMFLAQVQMAVRMLEAKDPYTKGHSDRVADFSVATARQLGLPATLLEELRLGGSLHDIGKIGTRDAILNKAGSLTPEEVMEIRRHTLDGEEMLAVLREDHPEVLQVVRWHHERMDGSGFPDGLTGERIPITARIVAVTDAFDAMTTDRAYRRGRTPSLAIEELRRCSGTSFDAEVVEAFAAAFPDPDRTLRSA